MGKAKRKSGQPVSEILTPFLAPIQAIQSLLSDFNDQGVIIGGVAVSLLSTPRFTADLDAVFLINIEEVPKLLELAAIHGIEPRISDAVAFARRSRMLLLRHSASGIDIDLSMGVLSFEVEMVGRSNLVEIGGIKIRLPTLEDLIIMKAFAHRQKDLEDIRSIMDFAKPEIDVGRIRYWVEQFAEALEMPNLMKDIEKFLQ